MPCGGGAAVRRRSSITNYAAMPFVEVPDLAQNPWTAAAIDDVLPPFQNALESLKTLRGSLNPPSSRLDHLEAGLDELKASLKQLMASAQRHHSTKEVDDSGDFDGAPGRPPASPSQQKLEQALDKLDTSLVSRIRFRAVRSDYYNWPLIARRNVLSAATSGHLCKTLVMENRGTTVAESPNDTTKPPRWIILVLQYTTKLNAVTVNKAVRSIRGPDHDPFPIKWVRVRAAHAEDSERLSGYPTGAVTPFGLKFPEEFTVLVSSSIMNLRPKYVWLGAGHVDVKMRVPLDDLITYTNARIGDFTDPKTQEEIDRIGQGDENEGLE